MKPILKIFRATLVYSRARAKADKMFKADGHRYFLIWDCAQDDLIAITYDEYPARTDSYKYLLHRGRFKKGLSREEIKELSFYYTPSRNGAPACTGEELKEKMLEFQRYYVKIKHLRHNYSLFSGLSVWQKLRNLLHLHRA